MIYGRLTLIRKTKKQTSDNRYLHEFKCSCGQTYLGLLKSVRSGNTKSCGCLKKEVSAKNVSKVRLKAIRNKTLDGKIHGKSRTRIYRIWRAIINRTTNPNNSMYYCYGGRGIDICSLWRNSFNKFYEDMGGEYKKHCIKHGEQNTSIERIDNDMGYNKENCKWATVKENNNSVYRPRKNGRFIKKY